MKVMMLTTLPAGGDFNFDSTCTSPSSPQRFGNYLFTTYDDQIITPLPRNFVNDEENNTTEFTFDFGGVKFEDSHFICADELFHGGKIKPLKVMQSSKYLDFSAYEYSPKSSGSPHRTITKALVSPQKKSTKDCVSLLKKEEEEKKLWKTKSSSQQKRSKSLSSFKISNMVSEPEVVKTEQCLGEMTSSSSSSTWSWYVKWKLMDILLFRGASDGDATIRRSSDKDDLKNMSCRSVDSGGWGSKGGSRRKKGVVSGHEWHYKSKRAVEEEMRMRRKTFLPYKKNLLGCMDLDLCVNDFSKGLAVQINC